MKIKIDKSKCIGCGTCSALCEEFFELGEEGKASLKGKGVKKEGDIEEMEVSEEKCARKASDACPVHCIEIE